MGTNYYKYGLRTGLRKVKSKATIVLAAAGLILSGGGGLSLAVLNSAHASPAPVVVYDALPSVSPPTNYPSQPFQAQQTSEFGDYIHLGGTARTLNSVTVTMSDWALQATPANQAWCTANPGSCDATGFTWPVTVNIYANTLDANGVPTTKLGSKTVNVHVPWRPAGDPTCGTTSNGFGWKVGSTCYDYSGIAFNANFDLSSLNLTLPNDVIIGFVYNTQTYGPQPTGVDGPYNSLNIAIPDNQAVTVGSDDSVNEAFWNTATASYYADGGAKGTNTFRKDTGWSPNGTVALQVTATSPQVGGPTSKDQCKNNGWKSFTNPAFSNQGQCIKWFEAQAEGTMRMSGPKQQIKFNLTNQTSSHDSHDYDRDRDDDHHNRGNNVEYWNYDYPGGLHYTAKALCTSINPATDEARFMFQIPAGHPGLSGLYIVAYVHEVHGRNAVDQYGHAATADLATATQWCQTGTGFSPTMYPVTKSDLEIE